MRTLVTGGAGFIGSNLVERLLAEGHDVRVLDNFSTGHRSNVDGFLDSVEVVEGDLRSYERAHNAVDSCEVVFHQGALPSVPRSIQDPITSTEVNALGTLNVLLAARDAGARRVVFASSSSVYGDAPGFPRVETGPTRPLSPYAVAKLAGEGFCRSASQVYGLETVALRYFNVFGRRQDPHSQYSAVIPLFITAMLAGERPTIFGDGEQSRDFTHIDNVLAANLLAVQAEGVSGQTINVAAGRSFSLNDLVATLNSLIGCSIEPLYAAERVGDVRESLADIAVARSLLGFEPRVGFEDGLRLTIESFEASHPVAVGS